MALGAERGQVLGLVLRQAMVVSLIGVVIGVAGSFAATPLMSKFLYGVKPHDLLTLVLVSSLLMAVTFVASHVPHPPRDEDRSHGDPSTRIACH
jgi:ABC-type antimicrobial peptide transport system permease subunit